MSSTINKSDAVMMSQPALLTVPPALGRYEIVSFLARGGMATVYLARLLGGAGFQRLYAVKVLHPHLADEQGFIDMFLDEARIAARLHHPNVVPVVDLGLQDEHHYIVMEYVEGATFSALLRKNRDVREPRLIVAVMLDTLAGLHAAHTLTDDDGQAMGLVHRDVSPQNILVGVDGTARITDFGIAKAAARINSTRPEEMKGKFAFMAPEQLKDGRTVDARTDVFACGIILWSALTGRSLFHGSGDAETLNNLLSLEVPAPSTIGLKPPAELDAVVLRALERDPDKRFQSAREMEDALREAMSKVGKVASEREVASWVDASFGEELTHRRSVLRATDARSGVSGVRMTPAITPAIGTQITPTDRGEASTETKDKDPRPSARRPLAIAGLAAVAIVLVAIGAYAIRGGGATGAGPGPLASAHTEVSPPPPSAVTTAPTPTTPTPSAALPPVAVAGPQAKAPSMVTIASKPQAPVNTVAPRHAPTAPPPTSEPTTPKAPASAKPKKAWDSDSPLLPP